MFFGTDLKIFLLCTGEFVRLKTDFSLAIGFKKKLVFFMWLVDGAVILSHEEADPSKILLVWKGQFKKKL